MPVIITVPVGFGKINGNGHSPFPEFFIQAARDIGIRTCMEGTGRIGNLIIGGRGIKHTEAVMVLGSKKKVFETAFLSQLRPFIRTEFYRIVISSIMRTVRLPSSSFRKIRPLPP